MKIVLIAFSLISIFAFFASAKMLPNWVNYLCSKGYDKHAHFLIFCVLQVFCTLVFAEKAPLSIAVILVASGIFVEIGQHFLTARTGDIMDVFANMAGVLTAFFLTQLFNKLSISIL